MNAPKIEGARLNRPREEETKTGGELRLFAGRGKSNTSFHVKAKMISTIVLNLSLSVALVVGQLVGGQPGIQTQAASSPSSRVLFPGPVMHRDGSVSPEMGATGLDIGARGLEVKSGGARRPESSAEEEEQLKWAGEPEGASCELRASCAWRSKQPKGDEDEDVRGCHCDRSCLMYGDCCHDAHASRQSAPETVVRNTTRAQSSALGAQQEIGGRHSWQCREIDPDFGHLLVRAKCHPGWPKEERSVREQCELSGLRPSNSDPLGTLMPITDLASGVTYANSYCLRCNTVQQVSSLAASRETVSANRTTNRAARRQKKKPRLVYWSPVITCSYDLDSDDRDALYDMVSLRKGQVLRYCSARNIWLLLEGEAKAEMVAPRGASSNSDQLRRNAKAAQPSSTVRECTIVPKAPESVEPLLRFCRPNLVDKCPAGSGGPNKQRLQLERRRSECLAGAQMLAYSLDGKTVYRNLACAQCNGESWASCVKPAESVGVFSISSADDWDADRAPKAKQARPPVELGDGAARSGGATAKPTWGIMSVELGGGGSAVEEQMGSFSVLMDINGGFEGDADEEPAAQSAGSPPAASVGAVHRCEDTDRQVYDPFLLTCRDIVCGLNHRFVEGACVPDMQASQRAEMQLEGNVALAKPQLSTGPELGAKPELSAAQNGTSAANDAPPRTPSQPELVSSGLGETDAPRQSSPSTVHSSGPGSSGATSAAAGGQQTDSSGAISSGELSNGKLSSGKLSKGDHLSSSSTAEPQTSAARRAATQRAGRPDNASTFAPSSAPPLSLASGAPETSTVVLTVEPDAERRRQQVAPSPSLGPQQTVSVARLPQPQAQVAADAQDRDARRKEKLITIESREQVRARERMKNNTKSGLDLSPLLVMLLQQTYNLLKPPTNSEQQQQMNSASAAAATAAPPTTTTDPEKQLAAKLSTVLANPYGLDEKSRRHFAECGKILIAPEHYQLFTGQQLFEASRKLSQQTSSGESANASGQAGQRPTSVNDSSLLQPPNEHQRQPQANSADSNLRNLVWALILPYNLIVGPNEFELVRLNAVSGAKEPETASQQFNLLVCSPFKSDLVNKFHPAMAYLTTCCLIISIASLVLYLLLYFISTIDLRSLLVEISQAAHKADLEAHTEREGYGNHEKCHNQAREKKNNSWSSSCFWWPLSWAGYALDGKLRGSQASSDAMQSTRSQSSLSSRGVACLSGALLAAYLLFIIGHKQRQSDQAANKYSCSLIATGTYYFFLLAFSWMFLLSYDIWRTLRLATCCLRAPAVNQTTRFIIYALCAILFSALVSIAAYSLDHVDLSQQSGCLKSSSVTSLNNTTTHLQSANDAQGCNRFQLNFERFVQQYRPKFGQRPGSCWFANKRSLALFFGLPVTVIMLVNLVFFLHSSFMVIRTSTNSSRRPVSQTSSTSTMISVTSQASTVTPDETQTGLTPSGNGKNIDQLLVQKAGQQPPGVVIDFTQHNNLTTSSFASVQTIQSNLDSESMLNDSYGSAGLTATPNTEDDNFLSKRCYSVGSESNIKKQSSFKRQLSSDSGTHSRESLASISKHESLDLSQSLAIVEQDRVRRQQQQNNNKSNCDQSLSVTSSELSQSSWLQGQAPLQLDDNDKSNKNNCINNNNNNNKACKSNTASRTNVLLEKCDSLNQQIGLLVGSLIKDYRLYCRLSTIMGLTWFTGLIASMVDQSDVLWYLFVVLNTLQGLFIFIAFGLKRSKLTNVSILLSYVVFKLARLNLVGRSRAKEEFVHNSRARTR